MEKKYGSYLWPVATVLLLLFTITPVAAPGVYQPYVLGAPPTVFWALLSNIVLIAGIIVYEFLVFTPRRDADNE